MFRSKGKPGKILIFKRSQHVELDSFDWNFFCSQHSLSILDSFGNNAISCMVEALSANSLFRKYKKSPDFMFNGVRMKITCLSISNIEKYQESLMKLNLILDSRSNTDEIEHHIRMCLNLSLGEVLDGLGEDILIFQNSFEAYCTDSDVIDAWGIFQAVRDTRSTIFELRKKESHVPKWLLMDTSLRKLMDLVYAVTYYTTNRRIECNLNDYYRVCYTVITEHSNDDNASSGTRKLGWSAGGIDSTMKGEVTLRPVDMIRKARLEKFVFMPENNLRISQALIDSHASQGKALLPIKSLSNKLYYSTDVMKNGVEYSWIDDCLLMRHVKLNSEKSKLNKNVIIVEPNMSTTSLLAVPTASSVFSLFQTRKTAVDSILQNTQNKSRGVYECIVGKEANYSWSIQFWEEFLRILNENSVKIPPKSNNSKKVAVLNKIESTNFVELHPAIPSKAKKIIPDSATKEIKGIEKPASPRAKSSVQTPRKDVANSSPGNKSPIQTPRSPSVTSDNDLVPVLRFPSSDKDNDASENLNDLPDSTMEFPKFEKVFQNFSTHSLYDEQTSGSSILLSDLAIILNSIIWSLSSSATVVLPPGVFWEELYKLWRLRDSSDYILLQISWNEFQSFLELFLTPGEYFVEANLKKLKKDCVVQYCKVLCAEGLRNVVKKFVK